MAEKTTQNYSNTVEVEEKDLQAALEDFFREEEKQEKSIWNISTITGLVMLFVVLGVFGQSLVSSLFGVAPAFELSWLLNILPVAGGALVLAAGFGYLTGENKKKKSRIHNAASVFDDFDTTTYKRPAVSPYTSSDKLDEFLKTDTRKKDSKGRRTFREKELESYALNQRKKLFRSRKDKKILGVCGGLANYFGISSTLVRIIFLLAFFLGYGSFLIVYIVLGIIMPTEPFRLSDRNFDLNSD